MKLKQKIGATTLVLCALAFSSAVLAKPMFQAGDIAVGAPQTITLTSGPASYFKDGSSGAISFTCELDGSSGVKASLLPGKNFMGNAPAILSSGDNGPFTWTLYDRGADNGNIKIQLLKGNSVKDESAVVTCQQIG